ncbi:hypothetical protein [Paraconexibacter sp. AEG42_29]|uniref:hypothetical protein n=1 Tax=Paraconexibacter sp. AEG42_29 TaxID=2997339 RepID=UPI00339D3E59
MSEHRRAAGGPSGDTGREARRVNKHRRAAGRPSGDTGREARSVNKPDARPAGRAATQAAKVAA